MIIDQSIAITVNTLLYRLNTQNGEKQNHKITDYKIHTVKWSADEVAYASKKKTVSRTAMQNKGTQKVQAHPNARQTQTRTVSSLTFFLSNFAGRAREQN